MTNVQPLLIFDVKLNEDDIKSFVKEGIKVNSLLKVFFVLYGIIIFVALFLFLLNPQMINLCPLVAIIILLIVAIYYLFYQNIKLYRKNQGLQSDMTYYIDDTEVKCKRIGAEKNTEWCKFYRITENKTHVFLWFNRKQAHILPKRCLSFKDLNSLHVLIKQFR